jgi:hypothetical protein
VGIRIKKQAETWENRWAVAYSTSQRAIGIELKDILSKRDWKIIETTSSEESAFATTAIGKAAMLILDDTDQDPAAIIQREQLFHQVACMTPTLIICSQHNGTDFKCMASMGEPVMVPKPISPKTLLAGMDELCEKWSQGYLVDVRRAAAKMAEGQVQTGFRILTDIVQSGQKVPLATSALALYYRRQDDLKMTEKILVSAIKQGVFEMSIILPLIDLYLYSGAPKLALRLTEMAFERFHKPNFLCIDAVQALLMLNRVKDVIPYLQQLIDNNYFPEVARHYLPRLYYSSGELEAFDKAIKYRPEKFDEYQRAWHLLADEDAARRKQQYEAQAQIRKQAARDKKEKEKEPIEEAPPAKRDKKSSQPLGFGPVGKPLFHDDGKTSVDG